MFSNIKFPRLVICRGCLSIREKIRHEFTDRILFVLATTGKSVAYGEVVNGRFNIEVIFSSTGIRITRLYGVTETLQRIHLDTFVSFVFGTIKTFSALPTPKQLAFIKREAINPALEKGINFYGHIRGVLGLGNSARNHILAMHSVGIPIMALNIPFARAEMEFPTIPMTEKPRYSTSVIQVQPEGLIKFLAHVNPAAFQGRWTVAAWVWELDQVPKNWTMFESLFDEIWTLSEFSATAFRKTFSKPVQVVPSCISDLSSYLIYEKSYFQLPNNTYTYLYIFDSASYFDRKNPFALVRAFQQAYGNSIDVLLVLKVGNPQFDPLNMEKLRNLASHTSNIRIYDTAFTDSEIYSLINACDCYVSPHRSEGFGLTPAEALYLHKAVIATDYGSTTDYLSEETGYPIEYKRVELEQDYGPYQKGSHWADISIEHLAHFLIHVRKHPEEARLKALKGGEYIRMHYSYDAIGKKIKELVMRN